MQRLNSAALGSVGKYNQERARALNPANRIRSVLFRAMLFIHQNHDMRVIKDPAALSQS